MASASKRGDVALRFGENLRHFRLKRRLSQEQLAFAAKLHRTEIGLLERGERVPRIDTVARLAGALSISPADLFGGITWEAPMVQGGRLKVMPREDR